MLQSYHQQLHCPHCLLFLKSTFVDIVPTVGLHKFTNQRETSNPLTICSGGVAGPNLCSRASVSAYSAQSVGIFLSKLSDTLFRMASRQDRYTSGPFTWHRAPMKSPVPQITINFGSKVCVLIEAFHEIFSVLLVPPPFSNHRIRDGQSQEDWFVKL